MEYLFASLALLASSSTLSSPVLAQGAAGTASAVTGTAAVVVDGASADDSPYVHDFEFVPEGELDPASVPSENGIAWYGTWEDAMAEKERTGKPVMLHMGSPRCPTNGGYRVPGTW